MIRREFMGITGAAFGALLAPRAAAEPQGDVAGHPQAAAAGREMLRAGGNAVDAVVTAALAAAVVSPHNCGIGGYGGHAVIAVPGAGGAAARVTAVDFNSAAPAAARPDMFPLEADGAVRGGVNARGWLAAGVPGTLAGLQLCLERYGTRSFREAAAPAIRLAREGFAVTAPLAAVFRAAAPGLRRDPGSARVLLAEGEPPREGALLRNPALAAVLQTLADRGSVASFYRGDIAGEIAAAFRKNEGLVTAADLAAYRAREAAPLGLEWGGCSIRTAPLTAGGATVLQALAALRALRWETRDPEDPRTTHARLEALRACWHDRLALLGDPEHAAVPLERLLSPARAAETAARVEEAVRLRRPLPGAGDGRPAGGTIHLSAVDAAGTLAALTLTHGEAFGARVTVEALGLVLGHGMSRFHPRPGHPNSPGPGKRPLHNMCPTVVLRGGAPVVAVGAAGGRRIVNTVCAILAHYAGRGAALEAALRAPRLHTEGGLDVTLDAAFPAGHAEYLREAGYTVRRGPGANASAAAR